MNRIGCIYKSNTMNKFNNSKVTMNILNSKVTMRASFKTSAARSGEHIQQN